MTLVPQWPWTAGVLLPKSWDAGFNLPEREEPCSLSSAMTVHHSYTEELVNHGILKQPLAVCSPESSTHSEG